MITRILTVYNLPSRTWDVDVYDEHNNHVFHVHTSNFSLYKIVYNIVFERYMTDTAEHYLDNTPPNVV